ncbi:unnamed protein product [Meganyctiphanes norvegica]|uniref:Methyltransferase domain-containing protein n=1 Tax=Meganyctiphanes norvegica TaxID=48144 RepID=A0AAV2QJS2_MEGNR
MALLDILLMLLFLIGTLLPTFASFFPPYLEGDPVEMFVTSLDPPDFRGEVLYKVEFTLNSKAGIINGMIHRSWTDFEELQRLIDEDITINPGISLPALESVETLNNYLIEGSQSPVLMSSQLVSDFLGINWNGENIGFDLSLIDFLETLGARVPAFAPEPPIFDNEDDVILNSETPFEVYLYLRGMQSKVTINEYLKYFESFIDTCPSFSGDANDNDVSPPSGPVEYPTHFNKTFVHFLPGGYLNGRTVRISYLGSNKFNFLNETRLVEWLDKLHGDKHPKRILDIGTGPGFSAFALATLYTDAEIIAVDLSAPYIRFARRWQTLRNISNIQFFHGNAEDLSWLESESFDFINYAYVLHEMPADNAMRILSEIYRLLATDGTMNGFEVPLKENPEHRRLFSDWSTFNCDDWNSDGPKGPEPYMYEFEFGTNLTQSLVDIGLKDVNVIDFAYFDSIYVGTK